MNKILKFLKENTFPLLIILICGVLAWKNYNHGTYLLGWDSIHSEFNFKDAFYRAISGVWREDQGLGTVAIHSHMADLPRIIFAWLISFLVPQNLIRYGYIFLCMFLGPLGIYYFLKYVFEQEETGWSVKISAFLGSLYYLLNLGTLQHFFVPFEMFTTQFAFLPWLFLYTLKYLRENKKSNLLIFGIITLVSTPMSYAATLFYAYFIGLLIFLSGYFLISKQKAKTFKRSFVIVIITLLINSFWLLPNLYSVTTQSDSVSDSRINTLFSPEAFLRNRDYGDISDILIHKSFLFGWNAFNFNSNQYSQLMKPWIEHLNNINVICIGYTVSAIYILGLLLSILKRNKVGLSLFGITILSLFFLFNENSITSNLFKYLYDNFGVFREGFRMPFTKFSLLFIFSTTFYFSYLLFNLFRIINKYLIGKVITVLISIAITLSLIFYTLPAFEGHFISEVVKTKLPDEYTQIFEWFNNNNNGRVAALPLNSLWGWENHDWKYEGSGFLSFGIKNPLLIRDFDRWSPHNETFFNEASFALYNNDKESFKKVLEKYEVRYLLLDESVINPGGDTSMLKYPEIKKMAEDLGFVKSFNSGFLTIYDTNIITKNISAINNSTSINADLTYSKIDPIYQKYGDFVENKKGITFPFVNFDSRGEVKIQVVNNELQIVNKAENLQIKLPIAEKITENFDISHGYPEANNCDLGKKGEVERKMIENGRQYIAKNGGVACDYFVFNNLDHSQAYAMHIKGENTEGRSLKFYLYNWDSKRVEMEELLPNDKFDTYYVIYPNGVGSGYTLNIETRSFGRITSQNTVGTIEFIPFDLNSIQELNTEAKLKDPILQSNLQIINTKKYGTSIYKVEMTGTGTLELGQGYENGWITYPKLKHLKINGWANGFKIEKDGTYYIIFWPQFLEWGGFLLLLLTLSYMIVKSKKIS